MRNAPTNSDDIIDSRDVVERISELDSERSDISDALDEAREERDEAHKDRPETDGGGPIPYDSDEHDSKVADLEDQLAEWDRDNGDELKALRDFESEAEGYAPDWRHGATLIRDSHFEDYARQFAEDIGAIKRDMEWPCDCIDWERAAGELQQDYTSADFDGVTYWVR